MSELAIGMAKIARVIGTRLPSRKYGKRGLRKHGPRTNDGTRRHDKAEFGSMQWMRRYRDRYAGAAA